MAINKQIQFLRNTNKIYTSRTEAVNAIETLVTGASTKGKILDGQPILARYKDTNGKVKTVTASVYKASNGSTQVTYYDEHVDEVYVGSGTPPSTTKLAVDVTENMVSIVQNTGTGTRKTIDVMSQKAVTDAIDAASSATKQSTIDALCDNVYIDASTPNTVALFSGENKRYNVSIPLTLKADSVYRVGKGSVIHFYMDGKLTGTGSIELNNTQIEAPKKRIFDDTVVIKGLMRCDAVYPEWFGAVGDGLTDDAVAIQKAIYNAGHMPVVLTAEKYLVKSTITLAEPFHNSNINPYFEYAHEKGSVWNDKQTLIVEHDIIGDISLDGPVIRTGSNQNYIKINGALVVRCPQDTAIGIDTAGTKVSGDTTSMTDIRSGDFGYSSEIDVRLIIKGKDGFSYQNSADETYATTYGLGKGTAVVFCSGAGGSCTVREINGFWVGIHIPFANSTKVSVNACGCVNDFLINGGDRFLGGGVTRNDIRLGTHYLNKQWPWISGRTDICIVRVNDDNTSAGQPVEVANNTFTIGSNNTSNAYIYNHILYKCGRTNFRGNQFIISFTLMSTGMSPWIPVKIAPETNGSSQNNANRIVHKVGWDYKTLDITKGYNTIVENVIIDSQEHTSTYRYGDRESDVQNRFLCEKVIITTKNAPEYPSNLSEDSIKVIVPHYSQVSKTHFIDTLPAEGSRENGHIYILKAVANTGGFEKHEVWGVESGVFKQLGYYSPDCDTQYIKCISTQTSDNVTIDASTQLTSTTFSEENKRYNITTPIELSADTTYQIGKGSVIHFYMDGKFTGSGTLQLNNTQIEAPKKRIFDDTVNIAGLMRCDAVYPEWFGAVGDGVTDDAQAIQNAIYNAGHMPVVLTAEKYLVKSTINMIEPLMNLKVGEAFGYTDTRGSKWSFNQTLIVEHDIIGDASLEGPVIRTGSNYNNIEIKGALVVRCPKDTAIGLGMFGTTRTGTTALPDEINSAGLAYATNVKINQVLKGPDGFNYLDAKSNTQTLANTYGFGKGTALLIGCNPRVQCEVKVITGFNVGLHVPFANGSIFDIGSCGCIVDILIDGDDGERFMSAGVTRNKFRIGEHWLSKSWSWVSGRTDICVLKIGDKKILRDDLTTKASIEVANNTFVFEASNMPTFNYIYNHIVHKCGDNNFRGNEVICSYTMVNQSMNPWKPLMIKPTKNTSAQNNANTFTSKVAFDFRDIEITKGYNTVVKNVIINSNTHSDTYRYGDTSSDVLERFLCEKVIITSKNAPELPTNTNEDSIKIIVPHYSQISRMYFVNTLPLEEEKKKGCIYILKAIAETGGFEKHEVWGYESGTFKQLGYYAPDYDTPRVKEIVNQLNDNVIIDESTLLSEATFADTDKRYNITVPIELVSGTTYTVGHGSVLHFYMDGKFTGSGTLQLSNTQIEAPKKRIFDDTVNIAGLMRCDAVYPEWWGAVGDGVADDAQAIQNAIYNAGHMPVVLTAEKYLVKSTINMVECWPNTGVTSAFEYTNIKGGIYNIKQTLIVEHDIIGDISLDGPVIRTGSNLNTVQINGALVVRCPNDTAIGLGMFGTSRTGTTNPPESILTGDLAPLANIRIKEIIKGPDSFEYNDNALNTADITTTYGRGKGTALVINANPKVKLDVDTISGFGVGLHTPSAEGSIFNIGYCSCIVEILIDGGPDKAFQPGYVRNNHFRIGTHYLSTNWPWVKGRSDVDIIRIGDNKVLDWKNPPQPTHVIDVWYNTFIIDGVNNGFIAYNHMVSKHGTNSFIGNKFINGCKMVDKSLRPWKPLSITPQSNSPEQNNTNTFFCKYAWDYKDLEVTKGFNCVIENVLIDSNPHSQPVPYGTSSQDKDIKERFLCEKIIITTKNSPELPATTTEDSIMIIVPHHSQMSKVHFVSEKPTSTTAQKGHIYVLDAVANTGGSEKHEVWGIESGTLKQLGYYSYDYLTQGAADRIYAKLNDTTQRISASSIVANTVSVDNNGFIMIGDHALAPANNSLMYNDYKLLDSSSIEQTTGTSTTSVMSQKAISDALSKKADLTNSQQTIRAGVTWTNDIYLGDGAYPISCNSNGDLTYNGDKVMVGKTVSNEVSLVQNTGQSTTSVMSQKAVSDALSTKVDKTDIVQSTGTSTTAVMSQKAVSDALSNVYTKAESDARYVRGEVLYEDYYYPNMGETTDKVRFTDSTEILQPTKFLESYTDAGGTTWSNVFECESFPDWFDFSERECYPYGNGMSTAMLFFKNYTIDNGELIYNFNSMQNIDISKKLPYSTNYVGLKKIDDKHFNLYKAKNGVNEFTAFDKGNVDCSLFAFGPVVDLHTYDIDDCKMVRVSLIGNFQQPSKYSTIISSGSDIGIKGHITRQQLYGNEYVDLEIDKLNKRYRQIGAGYSMWYRTGHQQNWSQCKQESFYSQCTLGWLNIPNGLTFEVCNVGGKLIYSFNTKSNPSNKLTMGCKIKIEKLA